MGPSGASWMCSTPFGINEQTTRTPTAHADIACCAQRLSASTNKPQEEAPTFKKPVVCSTPFGINEQTTNGVEKGLRGVVVLNAFRHQRTNHSTPPSPCPCRACA